MALQVLRQGRMPAHEVDQDMRLDDGDLQDVKQFFPMPKFFIFGHARSGTTLLARLIRVHPEVHCNWQAHFFTREPILHAMVAQADVRDWLNQRSFRWNQGEDLSPKVIRVVADFILEREAKDHGKRIVGDKSPNHFKPGRSVKLLHDIYPDGKLIFIVRDGRDVVLSHRFQTFIDFTEYLQEIDLKIRDDFSRDPDPFYAGKRSLFTEKWLKRDIRSWVENIQKTTEKGKKLFGDQFITLRYEDLLAKPVEHMESLWSFLEVADRQLDLSDGIDQVINRNPDAEWQRQQNEDMLRNLEKGKAGSWKELFTPRDCEIVREIAGDTLIDWGYEDDTSW